jgi:hypothetical protein
MTTFEQLQERWQACPPENRERMLKTLTDMAAMMRQLPDGESDADTIQVIIDVMTQLPGPVVRPFAVWSSVDGDNG